MWGARASLPQRLRASCDAMNRNILTLLLIVAALIAGALVWYPLW
jgi:hypothetical protein